jgi:hypothetical protein
MQDFCRKAEGKKPLGGTGRRWEDIVMCLRELVCRNADCLELT